MIEKEKLTVEVSDYQSLSLKDKRTVSALTLRRPRHQGSAMRDAIFLLKEKSFVTNRDRTNKVVLLRYCERIIGWAFLVSVDLTYDLHKYKCESNGFKEKEVLHCMFYINKKFRKKGLSHILMKRSIEECFNIGKNPYVSAWYQPEFFKKFHFNRQGFLPQNWRKKWQNQLVTT